jgi:hypothetical protein
MEVLQDPESLKPCIFHVHDDILRDIGANECRYPNLYTDESVRWDGKEDSRITDAYNHFFKEPPTPAIIDAYNHQSLKTFSRMHKYKDRGFKMVHVGPTHHLNKALFNSALGYNENIPFHQNAPFNPKNRMMVFDDMMIEHIMGKEKKYDEMLEGLAGAIKRKMKNHKESLVGEEDKSQEPMASEHDMEAGLHAVLMKYFPGPPGMINEEIVAAYLLRKSTPMVKESPETYLEYIRKHHLDSL